MAVEVWSQFEHDPRVAANATLRASDHDRSVITAALGEAYAEGRLTQGEYDERSDTALASRTLGELVPLVSDLPVAVAPPRPARTDLAERAERHYLAERRQAVWGFLSASLICWVIWFATDGAFPWPLFVMLGTGLNAGRVFFMKNEMIAAEISRLEKRQEKRDRKALPRPDQPN